MNLVIEMIKEIVNNIFFQIGIIIILGDFTYNVCKLVINYVKGNKNV